MKEYNTSKSGNKTFKAEHQNKQIKNSLADEDENEDQY
jgi:hypothetical protein